MKTKKPIKKSTEPETIEEVVLTPEMEEELNNMGKGEE
jgi:hypothetical protein